MGLSPLNKGEGRNPGVYLFRIIHDRKVAILENGSTAVRMHEHVRDGRENNGGSVSSGVYLYRFRTDGPAHVIRGIEVQNVLPDRSQNH